MRWEFYLSQCWNGTKKLLKTKQNNNKKNMENKIMWSKKTLSKFGKINWLKFISKEKSVIKKSTPKARILYAYIEKKNKL